LRAEAAGARVNACADRALSQPKPVMMLARWNNPARLTRPAALPIRVICACSHGRPSGCHLRALPCGGVIDAHHHLWDLAAREHRWLMGGQPWASDDELARLRRSFTLADLAPLAAAAGITGTVVIQTVAEPWETPDLLALAAGRDPYQAEDKPCGPADGGGAQPAPAGGLLAGVVGWTDLTAPAVADAAAGLRELPGGEFLCGIRHPVLAEADPGWLARPAVLRGLQALAAAGLSFDIFDCTARQAYRLPGPEAPPQHQP
jgi:hypothetical protein